MGDTLIQKVMVGILTAKGHRDLACMLRNAKNASSINKKLLFYILKHNRNTAYGKKYGFGDIRTVEDFKKKVPVIGYEEVADDVERIYKEGAGNLLCKDKVIGFATSSGSIGRPKVIPRTKREVGIYTKYTVTRFLALADDYRKKVTKEKFYPGRGICTLMQHPDVSPLGLPATNVADISAKQYYVVYPKILVLPLERQFKDNEIDIIYACVRFGLENKDCHYLFAVFAKTILEFMERIEKDWKQIVDDIEKGTINESVEIQPQIRTALEKKMKPNPKRAAELRREFEKGFDETIISRLWPNMSVISAIGTSSVFEGYVEKVKRLTKGIIFDCSIYGASEGLIAACYKPGETGQLMLPDSCYYEFADPEDTTYEHTLAIDELEVGKDYEIIVTNQSGFYRYRLKDIIHVMSYEGECPVINFVYRKGQLLNTNGEKTTMEQMTEAVKRLETLTGAVITEWAVFVEKGDQQYRYGIAIETPDGRDLSGYAEQFEQILRDVNTQYRYYEGMGLIDPPVILNQKPGSHAEWRKMKISVGATAEQIKPVKNLDTAEKEEFFRARFI